MFLLRKILTPGKSRFLRKQNITASNSCRSFSYLFGNRLELLGQPGDYESSAEDDETRQRLRKEQKLVKSMNELIHNQADFYVQTPPEKLLQNAFPQAYLSLLEAIAAHDTSRVHQLTEARLAERIIESLDEIETPAHPQNQ